MEQKSEEVKKEVKVENSKIEKANNINQEVKPTAVNEINKGEESKNQAVNIGKELEKEKIKIGKEEEKKSINWVDYGSDSSENEDENFGLFKKNKENEEEVEEGKTKKKKKNLIDFQASTVTSKGEKGTLLIQSIHIDSPKGFKVFIITERNYQRK